MSGDMSRRAHLSDGDVPGWPVSPDTLAALNVQAGALPSGLPWAVRRVHATRGRVVETLRDALPVYVVLARHGADVARGFVLVTRNVARAIVEGTPATSRRG